MLEIEGRGRVVVGMGRSGYISSRIAVMLVSTGMQVFTMYLAEAGYVDLGMLTGPDIVIGMSQSGKGDEYCRLFHV